MFNLAPKSTQEVMTDAILDAKAEGAASVIVSEHEFRNMTPEAQTHVRGFAEFHDIGLYLRHRA